MIIYAKRNIVTHKKSKPKKTKPKKVERRKNIELKKNLSQKKRIKIIKTPKSTTTNRKHRKMFVLIFRFVHHSIMIKLLVTNEEHAISRLSTQKQQKSLFSGISNESESLMFLLVFFLFVLYFLLNVGTPYFDNKTPYALVYTLWRTDWQDLRSLWLDTKPKDRQ